MEFDFIAMERLLSEYFTRFEKFAILYLVVANTSYAILLLLGFINSRKRYAESYIKYSDKKTFASVLKPLTMVVPCYNEEVSVVDNVNSIVKLNYPEYEVIVVNDGSSDNTLQRLVEYYEFMPADLIYPTLIETQPIRQVYLSKKYQNIILIDKENGGKADAMNAAINFSKYPLVCFVDSDSILDESSLVQVAIPFFEEPNRMVATGGTIRVANDSKIEHGRVVNPKLRWNYFSMVQVVEYLRAFLVGRMGWDYLNCTTIISGAFGLFKKEALLRIGGFDSKTIGEDFELLLKIQEYYLKNRLPFKVCFFPNPVCWTEVPSNFKMLGNQRSRWQQGLAEGLWSGRKMFFRPWSKQIGNLALPYLFFFELLSAPLELFSYIVTFLGIVFDLISLELCLSFLAVSIIYGQLLTVGAILIEEVTFQKYKRTKDFIFLIIGSMLEQIGFRQLHLYWRVRGLWRFLRGTGSWGEMKRKGLGNKRRSV